MCGRSWKVFWQDWFYVRWLVSFFGFMCPPHAQWILPRGCPEGRSCLEQEVGANGGALWLHCSSSIPAIQKDPFKAALKSVRRWTQFVVRMGNSPLCRSPVGWRLVGSRDGPQPAPLSAPGWTKAAGAESLEASHGLLPRPRSGPCRRG